MVCLWAGRYVQVNVLGLVSLTQKFLPAIRKNKGRIINVSSFTALVSRSPLAQTGHPVCRHSVRWSVAVS